VLEGNDLLAGQFVDEPAYQTAILVLDLALPLGGAHLQRIAMHAQLGDSLAEPLGVVCRAVWASRLILDETELGY